MEENKVETTQTADLPPIKNYPLYFWRVFRKLFVVAFFGVGSMLIVVLVFPIMRLLIRNNQKFRKGGHHFISYSLDFYIHLMSWLRVSTFKISKDDLQTLRNLKGTVIVANHPSMLDVIYTLAFVRDTDCIVKAALKRSWVSGIVCTLYITNNTDFEVMKDECVQALKQGGNLIIFPEGTRSPAGGLNQFKKGAARIALAAGAPIQPMHIGGNRKYGLGKGESMFKANPVEYYKYEFKLLPQIDISKYADLSETIAAKHLTDDMKASISTAS